MTIYFRCSVLAFLPAVSLSAGRQDRLGRRVDVGRLTAILFIPWQVSPWNVFGKRAAASAYGAASSLVTLGAEFTKVYAENYGSQIEPEQRAVKVERKEVELPST